MKFRVNADENVACCKGGMIFFLLSRREKTPTKMYLWLVAIGNFFTGKKHSPSLDLSIRGPLLVGPTAAHGICNLFKFVEFVLRENRHENTAFSWETERKELETRGPVLCLGQRSTTCQEHRGPLSFLHVCDDYITLFSRKNLPRHIGIE